MTAPKFAQVKKTFLLLPITTTETSSITLKRLVDIYGNNIDMADLGSIGYITLNPGGDNEEIISFTGFTRATDGSVTLDTGITRALVAKSPYGSGGTARDHSAGTVAIISNNPQVYDSIIDYIDGIALSGAPDASVTAKGLAEEATQAEIDADTASGSVARLFVNPSTLATSKYGTRLPSSDEKNAMAGGGTFGTPSTSNKFVTEERLAVAVDFGSGADGDADLDGVNTYGYLSKSGSDYTLTRNTYFNNLTIPTGSKLITDGYFFLVKGTFDGDGTLDWGTPNNGSNGLGTSGGNGGAQSGSGALKNQAGANAPDGGSNGNNGVGGASSSSVNPSIGGAGGNGGSGGGAFSASQRSGGTAGSVTSPQAPFGVIRWLTMSLVDVDYAGTHPTKNTSTESQTTSNNSEEFSAHSHTYRNNLSAILGGSGGASGAGGSGGSGSPSGQGGGGGGGGASGGIIFFAAAVWAGTFTIRSVGGNGGDGGDTSPTGGGGGGGGAGGCSVAIYGSKTWTGSYVLTGGVGGAAGTGSDHSHGSPSAGSNGTDGTSYEYDIKALL